MKSHFLKIFFYFFIFIFIILIKIQGKELKNRNNKTKEFYSYDPRAQKWSKIKNFENVKIVTKKPKKNKYLYKNVWAYNAQLNKWHLININSFYYKDETTNKTNFFSLEIGTGLGLGFQNLFVKGKNIDIGVSNKLLYITNKKGIPLKIGNINYLLGYFQTFKNTNNSLLNSNTQLTKITKIYGRDLIIPIQFSCYYHFKERYQIGFNIDLTFQFLNKFDAYGNNKKFYVSLKRKMEKLKTKHYFTKSPNIIFKPSLYTSYKIYKFDSKNNLYLNLKLGTSYYFSNRAFPIKLYTFRALPNIKYEKMVTEKIKIFSSLGPEMEYGVITKFNTRKVKGGLYTYSLKAILEIGLGYNFS